MHRVIIFIGLILVSTLVFAEDAADLQPITPDNASNLRQIAALGYGDVRGLNWRDDRTLAINTTTGIYLQDTAQPNTPPTLQGGGRLPVGTSSPDGSIIAARTGDDLYFYDGISGKRISDAFDVGYCYWKPTLSWEYVVQYCHSGFIAVYTISGIGFYRFATVRSFIDVTFSPDGKKLFVSTDDGFIEQKWCLDNCVADFKAPYHDYSHELLVSPDNKYLLVTEFGDFGDSNAYLSLWDIQTNHLIFEYPSVTVFSKAIFSPDGKYLIALTDTGEQSEVVELQFLVWKMDDVIKGIVHPYTAIPIPSGRVLSAYLHHSFTHLYFSLDNGFFAAQFHDSLFIWKTNTEPEKWTQVDKPLQIISRETFAFSPDSKRLAAAMPDGSVQIRAADTGELLSKFSGYSGGSDSFAISQDGRFLAKPVDCVIEIWDLWTKALVKKVGGCENGYYEFRNLAFTADGLLVVTIANNAHVWNIVTGEESHQVPAQYTSRYTLQQDSEGHFTVIYEPDKCCTESYLNLSPDASLLATMNHTDVILLDTSTGNERYRIKYPTTPFLTATAFSPDSRYLAVAGAGENDTTGGIFAGEPDDGLLEIRDLANNGKLVVTLHGHTAAVTHAVFTPSGLLVSAGDDETIRVWNPETGQQLAVLSGHVGRITDIEVLDNLIVSAGRDTIRMWGIPVGS